MQNRLACQVPGWCEDAARGRLPEGLQWPAESKRKDTREARPGPGRAGQGRHTQSAAQCGDIFAEILFGTGQRRRWIRTNRNKFWNCAVKVLYIRYDRSGLLAKRRQSALAFDFVGCLRTWQTCTYTHTHRDVIYSIYYTYMAWYGKLFMVCHGELTTWLINSGT